VSESLAELTREFVSEFLAEGEEIEGPLILAEAVDVYTDINKATGLPRPDAEPIASFKNVYVVNTNKRFIIAYRGLVREGEVSDTSAYEGYREGIWKVERTRKVVMDVEDRTGVFSIDKGETKVSFKLGLKATSTFTTGISKPYLASLLAKVLGILFLLAGALLAVDIAVPLVALPFAYSPIHILACVLIGLALLALAAGLARARKALIFYPSTAIESTSELYIFNMLSIPRERLVKVVENAVAEELTKLETDFTVMHIKIHPAVSPEVILEFVKAAGRA